MNQNTTDFMEERNQEEKFDVKKFIYLIKRQWHWFALFSALGIFLAYGYTKLTKPSYLVSTSIMVPEKSDALNMKNIFQGVIDMPKKNIYNHIEIIKSYYTINKTLINLNWRTSWYIKDLFIWKGIYKQEPFDVQEAQNFINLKGIAIYITPTFGDNYRVSMNGKVMQDNKPKEIKVEGSGEYGHPFVNKYFNFTLLKKVNNFDAPGSKYYFVFNDLNEATLEYQFKLNASLTDKKSDIILCTLRSEEPEKDVDFLNELINVYTEGQMDYQNEAQRRSLDFINTQLTGISD